MKESTLIEVGSKIFGMVALAFILGGIVLFIIGNTQVTSIYYKTYPVIFILSICTIVLSVLLKKKWISFCDYFIVERTSIECARKNLGDLKAKELWLNKREEALKNRESKNDEREKVIKDVLSASNPLKVVSTLYADIASSLFCDTLMNYLIFKPRPALTAAANVKHIKRCFKEELEKYKMFQYKYETIESLYPEIADFFDDDIFDESTQAAQTSEVETKWKTECTAIDEDERAQFFLECYMQSHNKTKWEIGRDYETFIAYLFYKVKNNVGTPLFHVIQEGANKKLEDRGRDVIAINKETGMVYICQCKMWAKDKTIFEKHIFQLYGSALDYAIRNNLNRSKVVPVFITTIKLSEYAKKCAEYLGVIVRENFQMGDYAPIKLNINEATGEKIYHLPFDQQYDNVKIENEGEGYAKTVAEAVEKGFRRAHRYCFNDT